MPRIAEVRKIERVDEDGAKGTNLVVDEGGNPITVEHFTAAGVDSCPMVGDFVALDDARETALGYADVKNEDTSEPGELRAYARDDAGAIVVELFLHKDGSAVIVNKNGGRIEMAPDGVVTINKMVIDKDGNVSTPGEIAADGEITAIASGASVTVSQHVHPHPMGPTDKPTPGT